ncbi:MAG: LON peptidase substrate-binding domain-containing protein, partial [Pseudomonadales bacterium]
MTDTILPIVTLRDMVVYPHGVQPLFIGTPKSIKALDQAQTNDKQVPLVTKREPDNDNPGPEDLHRLCTPTTP